MRNKQLVAQVTEPATASGIAITGNCYFIGVIISLDGISDVTLNVFDSLTASGKNLLPDDILIDAARNYFGYEMSAPVRCINGIYIDITCAGTYSYQASHATARTPGIRKQ